MKSSLFFLKNKNGFGLMEVMIAASITAGLALVIAEMINKSEQSAKGVEAKLEKSNLKSSIINLLGDKVSCNNTFGTTMTPANITALQASTSASVALANLKDKINSIKYSSASTDILPLVITSINLTNYSAVTPDEATLIIKTSYKKSASTTIELKPISVPVTFTIAAGAFVECSANSGSVAASASGLWAFSGNSGTVDGTDFIGTTDNVPLNFKVNNIVSGRISPVGQTFFGYSSGKVNIRADSTGFGFNALEDNTIGAMNTAIGYRTLASNTVGGYNTAVGNRALELNTTADGNSAFGNSALSNNTIGIANTALGDETLVSNISGGYNLAVGFQALKNNTTGNNNIALGTSSLFANTTGNNNYAIGHFALSANTTGASNLAFGYEALRSNTTGSNNIAHGYQSLKDNTTGNFNVAMGVSALTMNTNGNNNVAIGQGTLAANIGGLSNVALGYLALNSNTGGGDNVAIGHQALRGNTTGGNNIALGYMTLDSNTTGLNNIAMGYSALTNNTTGRTNIALGFSALTNNINGDANVVIGFNAAAALTTGSNNIIIGKDAGDTITGSNNLAIGSVGLGQPLIFGDQTAKTVGVNSTFTVMNPNAAAVGLSVTGNGVFTGTVSASGSTLSSDIRFKEQIVPVQDSLERISKLNAYNYYWKDKVKFNDKLQIGLIAQEVEKVFPEAVTKNEKGFLAVSYSNLVAPVINAIKELYAKVVILMDSDIKQNKEIQELKAENEKLKLEMKFQQNSFDERLKKLEASR